MSTSKCFRKVVTNQTTRSWVCRKRRQKTRKRKTPLVNYGRVFVFHTQVGMWKTNTPTTIIIKMTNRDYPNTTPLVFSVADESFQVNYCMVFVFGLCFPHNSLGVWKTKTQAPCCSNSPEMTRRPQKTLPRLLSGKQRPCCNLAFYLKHNVS